MQLLPDARWTVNYCATATSCVKCMHQRFIAKSSRMSYSNQNQWRRFIADWNYLHKQDFKYLDTAKPKFSKSVSLSPFANLVMASFRTNESDVFY